MEVLYNKLYNKYTKLKAREEHPIEKFNQDQETKFMAYVEAADDLIGHLRSERDKLSAEVSELRNEVASIRYAKDQQYIEHQKLLLEENQKNKELSEEIERLRNKDCHPSFEDDRLECEQQNMSGSSRITVGEPSNSTKRKRGRYSRHENEVTVTPITSSDPRQHDPIGGSNSEKQPGSTSNNSNEYQPKCCRRRVGISGIKDSCMFQELVESLLDLKFSIISQNEEIFISAVHESSGYTFSLKWMKSSGDGRDEEELLYRATSFGTFERVAPEWMRDVILFSKRMCPIFFKRLSYVVKLHNC